MDLHTPSNALHILINNFRTPSVVCASEVAHNGMSENRRQLFLLEARLREAIVKSRKREPATLREANEIVAVQSKNDDRLWHRGRIMTRVEYQSGIKYKVLLLDQGIILQCKPEQLQSLPFKVEDVPYQALTLILDGIVPIRLAVSPDLDGVAHNYSADWTPAAENCVEEIKNTYIRAYFVEKEGLSHGQVRYGDILIVRKGEEKPFSLSERLCEKKFAKYDQLEFDKRPKIQYVEDAPEICNSPLSCGYQTDTPDSCSPSPARSMFSPNSNQEKRTLSEYLQSKKKKAQTSTPPPTNVEPITTTSPQPKGARNLLALLKKRNNNINNPGNIEQTSAPMSSVSLSPTEGPIHVEEEVSPSVHTRRSSVGRLSPKVLSPCLIPAGYTMKKEAKALSRPSSSSSYKMSSDSEDSFQNGPSFAFKATKNGGDQIKRLVYSSDSSISDNSAGHVLKNPVPQADSIKHDAKDVTEKMSLLLKLKKSQTKPPSSKTDESSTSATESTSSIRSNKLDSNSNDKQNQDSSSLMQSRLLSAPRISSSFDDDTCAESYLARSVLLHGGFPPKPWVVFNDLRLKFSTTIEKYLIEKRWCYNIMTLEKYMWPAIQQRQNVVMISPKKSGKTTSYIIPIMDFMCSLEESPKGCGPLALILCSGSQSAIKIYEECVKIVRNTKKPPQVKVAYGLVLEKQFILKLINGCEIFITTPPCLLRILKNHSYAMNFNRLQHVILDEADILMSKFLKEVKDIQAMVVAEQAIRTKDERDPIQIVVSSEKWENHLLSFSEHLRGNPLLCINDCFEACVYGRPDVFFHLIQSNQKLSKLIQVLKDLQDLQKVVVFCDVTEILSVQEFIENACMNCLVVGPSQGTHSRQATLSSWNSSKPGKHYILVCPDTEFDDMKITDATSVVHYSLPFEDKSYFVKRLSAIRSNLPNKIEERKLKTTSLKPHHLSPSIHILMDESNSEQLPVVAQLMQRIAGKLDQRILDKAKSISMSKEKRTRMNKLFCRNIKMFGQCWDGNECSNRHVFVPELDLSEDLPSSGVVTMLVTQIHSAGHFSVRLTEHIDVEKNKKELPSGYLKLAMLMSSYFKQKSSRILIEEINVGDLFAVESEPDLFQRVRILEVKDRDKYGKPVSMLVQYIDEGHYNTLKGFMLHHLPEDLKTFPALVVDVYLCGLLPADQDKNYGADANSSVKKWMKSEDGKQKLLQGQIMLSMAGSLWVDPVNILMHLPTTKEVIVETNIKKRLLLENYACPNEEHLPQLFSLCGKDPSVLSSVNAAVQCTIKPKAQPKPSWAFLETNDFEEIEFISAESVSVFFVRKVKFQPQLNELIKEINTTTIPWKSEEISVLSPESICLAKYDNEWHRVRITSQNEDHSFTVFYVDFGDSANVTHEEIKCIPTWAITRLPFQAIECSLAGVSSCDTVDKLYDVADGRSLVAKVVKRKEAVLSGGNHYVLTIVDCSKPNPSILNKDLLEFEGVEQCEEELEYLNFQIDPSFFNRYTTGTRGDLPISQHNTVEEDLELDLSDLEFKEEDLDGLMDYDDTDDGLDNFEICGLDQLAESFKKQNEAVVEKLSKQIEASTLAQQPQLESIPKNRIVCNSQLEENQGKKEQVTGMNSDRDSDWEGEEHLYVGRNVLPVLCRARPPTTKWLEDLYYVWIKICLTGVESYFLRWTSDSFQFSTSVNGRLYHIDQHLRGAIIPSCVTSSIKGFSVEIKMKKAHSGVLWERLLFPKQKFPWLRRDLEAIDLNSSDSEGEDTLKNINKEIRKMPMNLRRRPVDKFERNQGMPDLDSDDPDSSCEYDMVESDELEG